MTGRIVLFPKVDLASAANSLDPNLLNLFAGDDMFRAWDDLELAAMQQVQRLLQKRSSVSDGHGEVTEEFVARIAAFFLQRAAERAVLRSPSMSLIAKRS
jgi:hypothetical protein